MTFAKDFAALAIGERFVTRGAAGLVPFDPERVVALRRVGDAVFKQPVGAVTNSPPSPS